MSRGCPLDNHKNFLISSTVWRSRGPASVSVLVLVAHVSVSVSVLVSEVPGLSTGSREPRPASRPNLDVLGLGFGLDHPGLGLSLGGPGLDYNPDFFHVVSNFSGGMRPESGRVVLVLGRVRGAVPPQQGICSQITPA